MCVLHASSSGRCRKCCRRMTEATPTHTHTRLLAFASGDTSSPHSQPWHVLVMCARHALPCHSGVVSWRQSAPLRQGVKPTLSCVDTLLQYPCAVWRLWVHDDTEQIIISTFSIYFVHIYNLVEKRMYSRILYFEMKSTPTGSLSLVAGKRHNCIVQSSPPVQQLSIESNSSQSIPPVQRLSGWNCWWRHT